MTNKELASETYKEFIYINKEKANYAGEKKRAKMIVNSLKRKSKWGMNMWKHA